MDENRLDVIKFLYGLPGLTITLNFSPENLVYLKEKFEINDLEDLENAIYECIDTYMEM